MSDTMKPTEQNIKFSLIENDDSTSVLSEEDYREEEEGEEDDKVESSEDETTYGSDDDDNDDDDDDDDDDDKSTSFVENPNITKKKMSDISSNKGNNIILDDDEETDTDEESEYLTKFNNDVKRDHILENHPEIIQSNYDEITALCKVLRDENGNIIDPIHKTTPILTKYEITRVLGLRTKQLNSGSDAFIKVPDNIVEGYLIAQMELEQRKIPFIIVRPLPGGKKEYWYLKDLEIVDY